MPTPNTVALARHVPSSRIARYDEETCDGVDTRGVRTIELIDLFDSTKTAVFPARDVQIITYEE